MLGESGGASQCNDLSGTVAGPSVQAGSIHGGIRITTEPRLSIPHPAQLPRRGLFVGRDKDMAGLRRRTAQDIAAGRPVLLVLTGAAGVGKTALALNWLHQLQEEYADGQLFVDLRGFTGDGDPMSSSDALGQFLRALGIGAESVPAEPDEQAALFRSLTADRRLIIMLDNAATADQVRPLLPGSGPALVVVTTRQRLQGLAADDPHFVPLMPLNESGTLELLSRIVGRDRIRAEPDAALSLVSLCGGLPLAAWAFSARLTAPHGWTIARVVTELADGTHRLSALSVEDGIPLRAILDGSYRALAEDAARLYRLLSVHPGRDFDLAAAAALAGVDDGESARLLDSLAGVNLLDVGPGERFRFQDLVRLHAREKLEDAESKAAAARLVDHDLAIVAAPDRAVSPGQ